MPTFRMTGVGHGADDEDAWQPQLRETCKTYKVFASSNTVVVLPMYETIPPLNGLSDQNVSRETFWSD
jgi:hypothetical protein